MKHLSLLILGFSMLAVPAFSQTPTTAPATSERGLTKFNLDFPGGTPGELVTAIQKAMGRPLNAIIPNEHANRRLPTLKMSQVDVAQLFEALAQANITREGVGHAQWDVQAGFYTTNSSKVSDDTVWFFRVQGAHFEQLKVCRVYLLTPYLEQGLTVDDVTTAIRTSWKMLGDPGVPQSLTFHKETNLLLAVADQRSLETIDAVLNALKRPKPVAAQETANAPDEKKSKE